MKQKLQVELKNVPKDAPQVLCSTSMPLNKEETLSVVSEVLACNNPEVDLHQHAGEFKTKMYVFVLSITGEPLMPCKPAKARKLLKAGKATVKKLYPFTIQLNFECENQVQDVSLGIDTGFGNIGFSAVTDTKEVASGTLILDGKTSERLTEKRMYRKLRRAKHHWYREPRFNNRKKLTGCLPPSTQRRYDTHLRLISKYQAILPISKITIEVAKFDIQKIENPEIEGVEYQEGDMYGYQNMRSYLMAREKGECQVCRKEFTKSQPSHIHHCLERSKAGSNRAKNLAILHKKCHENLHKKGMKIHAHRVYKAPMFMSIINKRFLQDVPGLNVTYGNITFVNRIAAGLEKTHYNDAFVIAGGNNQEKILPVTIKQKHRNNRCLQINRKGYKPSIRRQRYKIQPKDIVWVGGNKHVTAGCMNLGKAVMIHDNKTVGIKKIEKAYHFGSLAYS